MTPEDIDYEDVVPRLWGQTDIVDGPIYDSPCWVRRGYIDPTGYGKISINGRPRWAHRVSWIVNNDKPIPAGMQVMHRCDVRACVRPDHLTIGTPADNIADRDAKGRTATGDHSGPRRRDYGDTCKRGHPRSEHTGRMNGRRYCLRCHADRENARYHARKAFAA